MIDAIACLKVIEDGITEVVGGEVDDNNFAKVCETIENIKMYYLVYEKNQRKFVNVSKTKSHKQITSVTYPVLDDLNDLKDILIRLNKKELEPDMNLLTYIGELYNSIEKIFI